MIGLKIRDGELRYALSIATGEKYEIPEGVRKISPRAFRGNDLLRSVSIPKSVEEIGEDAFRGCASLEKIDIPDTVRVVGDGAFAECPSLKKISFDPKSTVFGFDVFASCDSLGVIVDGGEEGRMFHFAKDRVYIVALFVKETDSGVRIYKGRYANYGFPTTPPVEGSPEVYLATCHDASGKEYMWYSTIEEDAVEGAFLQANHESIAEHFGFITLDTEVTPRDISMITGLCMGGMEIWCKSLKIDLGAKKTVREVLDIMGRVAPGAQRRLLFVLQHQYDEDLTKDRHNEISVKEIRSSRKLPGEVLTEDIF